MSIFYVLLIALTVGIFVALKSKKLTATELIVCGSFGLLLGATAIGKGINKFILSSGDSLVETLVRVFG